MSTAATAHTNTRSWIFYAALLILFWGCGAPSPPCPPPATAADEMIYSIWALTMIIPAVFALRGQRFDRRPQAAVYGLLIRIDRRRWTTPAVSGAHHGTGLPDLPHRVDLAGGDRGDGHGAAA